MDAPLPSWQLERRHQRVLLHRDRSVLRSALAGYYRG